MTKDKKNKNGNYSGDPSEMRKAPGYENAEPIMMQLSARATQPIKRRIRLLIQ